MNPTESRWLPVVFADLLEHFHDVRVGTAI